MRVETYWTRKQDQYNKSDFTNPIEYLTWQGVKISNKTRKLISKW